MQPSDFFTAEQDPEWDVKGLDPWNSSREVFNTELVNRLRTGPQEGINDVDAAYGLAQLTSDELEHYGTNGVTKLNDEEIALVLRALRAVVGRLQVTFDPPFRNFGGFRGYWSGQGMSGAGGWGMRRAYLTSLFNPVFAQLERLEEEQTSTPVRGVDGQLKNIIFASTGRKPRIVLTDAINNVIEVVENAEYCLFYDRPLSDAGLTWAELVDWWRATNNLEGQDGIEVGRSLYRRLAASLGSEPERTLFRAYCARYGGEAGGDQPALLPHRLTYPPDG